MVPSWLQEKSRIISAGSFHPSSLPFGTYDLFGDGTIELVDLPGHAPGHIGLRFMSEGDHYLYATDAYWETAQIEESVDPFGFALNFEWRAEEYKKTIQHLRVLSSARSHKIVSCHAQTTQTLVAGQPPRT